MERILSSMVLIIYTLSFFIDKTAGLPETADGVFFMAFVQNYLKCYNLCASISTCKTVNYQQGICELTKHNSRTTPTNNALNKAFAKFTSQIATEISAETPCRPDEFCITTTSGQGFMPLNYKQASPCDDADMDSDMIVDNVVYTITGAEATYTCVEGYTHSEGTGDSRCLHTQWTEPSLKCQIVDCGIPRSQPNATASFPSTTYGATATYSCDVGYTGTGSGTSKCQAEGTWSTPALTCTYDTSGGESLPPFLDLDKGNTSGDTTSFACANRFSGPSDVKDDAMTSVQCEDSEILTGCTSLQMATEPHLDGESILGNATCIGVNNHLATGPVRASARCCSKKGLKCEYLKMNISSNENTETPTNGTTAYLPETCKDGYWPTGCATRRWEGKVYGAYLTAEGCGVDIRDINAGFTICCTSPNLNCTYVESAETGPRLNDSVAVSCPDGYTMLGCTGYSPSGSIMGSYTTGSTQVRCVVGNGKQRLKGEARPRAFASCCKTD